MLLIFLLIVLVILILLNKTVQPAGPEPEKAFDSSGLTKEYEKTHEKTNINFRTKQKNIMVVFDQPLEGIEQPFLIPKTIELSAGKYTFQAFKKGFVTETVSLDLEYGEQKNIEIELDPLSIKSQFYRLLTEKNVKAVGWKQSQLLYHVKNEIKEAEKNLTLAVLPENSQVQFTSSGRVLVSSQNNHFLITNFPKVVPLEIKSSLATLSPTGEKLAFINEAGILEIEEITSGFSLAKFTEIEGSVLETTWSFNEDVLAFFSVVQKDYYVYVYNLKDRSLTKIFSAKEGVDNIVLSPEGGYLAITTGRQILIYDLASGNPVTAKTEDGLLSSLIVWRKEMELILIEKVKQNGKVFDKIWLTNPLTGEKSFLAISAPLVNRIDFAVDPSLSLNNNALALAENDSLVWLFVLEGSLNDFFPSINLPSEGDFYSAP